MSFCWILPLAGCNENKHLEQPCNIDSGYKRATDDLRLADEKTKNGDLAGANALLKAALYEIRDYKNGNAKVIDDSGVALSAGDALERDGDLKDAANARRRALVARIELYGHHHRTAC